MKKPTASKKPKTSTNRGGSDFTSFILAWGHPEWVVYAVEAPLHDVSKIYGALRGTKDILLEVPIQLARKKDDTIAPAVAIVQPKDSQWSVILEMLSIPLQMDDLKRADDTCKKLSTQLKTRALQFAGEDTSGAMGYTLFAKGRKVEQKEWEDNNESPDAEFDALGIYLPACYPCREKNKTWLCATKESLDRIAQADIVEIET